MLLTQARLPDGLSVWLVPTRDEMALTARGNQRASNEYLSNRRAIAHQPAQLETVTTVATESRQVYEVVPYVPYDGFSRLKGVEAYAATQNVLGTQKTTVDDYA